MKNKITDVYVVDDEEIIVDSIKMGLELKGYNVIGFNSAEKLLDYLASLVSGYPDLIISDYRLSSKNGLDMLKEIREKFGNQIKIIIMTGYGDKALVIETFRQGADDFIDKPVSIENLMESILKIENKNREYLSKNKVNDYFNEISHELRNRLTGIITHVDKIESANTEENLSFLKEEVSNLDNVIKNILDPDNFGKNNVSLNKQNVSIMEILDYGIKLLEPNALSKKINIKKLINDFTVNIDKEKMMQVFINLMLNAIYYSPDNNEIVIKADKINDCAKIEIADRAETIPDEFKKKVFEKDFRLSKQKSGFGIGLYVVKKIINSHNGEIHIEDNLNKGNIFVIRIPLK
ncbi:MAG TPA: hybrid sensor histidine kinase/response regulator [bacterium]|nr:hybrid sensor histidine kinase/response regulator [bacterium]HPN29326.1 hybrid sensor histidine kinase/response regulator [bacterium]